MSSVRRSSSAAAGIPKTPQRPCKERKHRSMLSKWTAAFPNPPPPRGVEEEPQGLSRAPLSSNSDVPHSKENETGRTAPCYSSSTSGPAKNVQIQQDPSSSSSTLGSNSSPSSWILLPMTRRNSWRPSDSLKKPKKKTLPPFLPTRSLLGPSTADRDDMLMSEDDEEDPTSTMPPPSPPGLLPPFPPAIRSSLASSISLTSFRNMTATPASSPASSSPWLVQDYSHSRSKRPRRALYALSTTETPPTTPTQAAAAGEKENATLMAAAPLTTDMSNSTTTTTNLGWGVTYGTTRSSSYSTVASLALSDGEDRSPGHSDTTTSTGSSSNPFFPMGSPPPPVPTQVVAGDDDLSPEFGAELRDASSSPHLTQVALEVADAWHQVTQLSPRRQPGKYWELCYGGPKDTAHNVAPASTPLARPTPAGSWSAGRAPPLKSCMSTNKKRSRAVAFEDLSGLATSPESPWIVDHSRSSPETAARVDTTPPPATQLTTLSASATRSVQFGQNSAMEFHQDEPCSTMTPMPAEVAARRFPTLAQVEGAAQLSFLQETKDNTALLAEWDDHHFVFEDQDDEEEENDGTSFLQRPAMLMMPYRRRTLASRRSSSLFSPSQGRRGLLDDDDEEDDHHHLGDVYQDADDDGLSPDADHQSTADTLLDLPSFSRLSVHSPPAQNAPRLGALTTTTQDDSNHPPHRAAVLEDKLEDEKSPKNVRDLVQIPLSKSMRQVEI